MLYIQFKSCVGAISESHLKLDSQETHLIITFMNIKVIHAKNLSNAFGFWDDSDFCVGKKLFPFENVKYTRKNNGMISIHLFSILNVFNTVEMEENSYEC